MGISKEVCTSPIGIMRSKKGSRNHRHRAEGKASFEFKPDTTELEISHIPLLGEPDPQTDPDDVILRLLVRTVPNFHAHTKTYLRLLCHKWLNHPSPKP